MSDICLFWNSSLYSSQRHRFLFFYCIICLYLLNCQELKWQVCVVSGRPDGQLYRFMSRKVETAQMSSSFWGELEFRCFHLFLLFLLGHDGWPNPVYHHSWINILSTPLFLKWTPVDKAPSKLSFQRKLPSPFCLYTPGGEQASISLRIFWKSLKVCVRRRPHDEILCCFLNCSLFKAGTFFSVLSG